MLTGFWQHKFRASKARPAGADIAADRRLHHPERCDPSAALRLRDIANRKEIADFVRLCIAMCKRPAKFASGPPIPKAKVISPMCSIEE